MTWLLWRQHRVQVAMTAALLVALAVPVLVTGADLSDAWNACRADRSCSGGGLFQSYNAMITIVDLTLVVPLIVGVFLGATVIGKELDSGTATLAWTQSVTRRRWMWSKIATLFGLAIAIGAGVSGLVTWWSKVHNALLEPRFGGLEFDIQGLAPVAYTVFAAALGLAAGVLWRRLLPAMGTTVAGFIGTRMLVELVLRPHYGTPAVRLSDLGPESGTPRGAMVISQEIVHYGHIVAGDRIVMPAACRGLPAPEQGTACMRAQGYQMRTTYQPAGRYWSFQVIEAGIFVALAAVLVAVAVVTLRRHDA